MNAMKASGRIMNHCDHCETIALIAYCLSSTERESMAIFWDRRDELEKYEFMMGLERGRLAVTMDVLTDALTLIGQHGVYCISNRNPSKPALDLQVVLQGINDAKELISSVMEELRKKKEAEHSGQ